MVITMHGDELPMVHFSEPEMHPTEGSSKRQRWQVRTRETGAEEHRRNGTLAPQSKFPALQGAHYPGPQPHPILSWNQASLTSCSWALLTLSHCEAHHDQHTYKNMGLHFGILGIGAARGVP